VSNVLAICSPKELVKARQATALSRESDEDSFDVMFIRPSERYENGAPQKCMNGLKANQLHLAVLYR
jgi:hypothetical protein